jgi:predicted flap endonuclease-1-like 5' DNA nuclease
MQEFFVDYGLWLLIALLVVIGLVFLLSGRAKGGETSAVDKGVDTTPPPVVAPAPQPASVATPPEPSASIPASPLVEAAPIPLSPAVVTPDTGEDDLSRLKGVGPKLKTQLTVLGITRFAQIAAWTESDIATIDAQLGSFKGRPIRDQWVDQAKYLAAGDVAGFEAKYGKL